MAAFKVPLKIDQGATFRKSVTWKAGTPAVPVDLTGCTARMHARAKITDTAVLLSLATPVRTVTYSANAFYEALADDGSIASSITLTLAHDTFTGTDGQPLTGAVVTGVPAGLTAVVTKTSSTTATVSLTGNATSHTDLDDTAITVVLNDTSFTGGYSLTVTNSTSPSLAIDFDLPSTPAPLVPPSSGPGGITLGGVDGTVEIYLSDEQTTAIDWATAVYDLEIEFANGEVRRLLQGAISVSPEVTRV